MKNKPWDLKSVFLKKVGAKGGFVNCHAHFDKSHIITYENLLYAESTLQQKWEINNRLKKQYTFDDLVRRISLCVDKMIAQGVQHCLTFADVDTLVGMTPLKAMLHVKEKYKKKINILVANQVLRGVLKKEEQKLYEEAAEMVDILGGLPEYEYPHQAEHLDFIFKMAKKHNKRLHVHIDQENNPDQKDTKLIAKKTIQHGWEGKVSAIHCISLAAQEKAERKKIIKLVKQAGIDVIVCPSEALNMLQLHEKVSPMHNSIAPVVELIEAGINVAIGTDNIFDIYGPFNDGDMFRECHVLMDAIRWWHMDEIVKIATVNGRRALGIKKQR